MAVNRGEIEREIRVRLKRSPLMRRRAQQEAEGIRDTVRDFTPGPGGGTAHVECKHDAPYATGSLQASIVLERRRERFGMPHWWLGSRHPNVNLVEFGTGPDGPNTNSPWGRFTPTPEFGMFAKTAAKYGGTMD